MNPRKQSELDKMFDYQTVYNAYTALIAGLITSVHCVAMCGPLSCAFTPTSANDANPQFVLTCYHLAKLFSYAMVGTLLPYFAHLTPRVSSSPGICHDQLVRRYRRSREGGKGGERGGLTLGGKRLGGRF